MRATAHGSALALTVCLLAGTARADYIASETLVLRPEAPAGAAAPTSFNFGASNQFTTTSPADLFVVPLTLNGASQTFVANASNANFAPTVALLTSADDPWIHWAVQSAPGTVAGGALVQAHNFFFKTLATSTIAAPPGYDGLAGATINDIKLTVNNFSLLASTPTVDVYSVSATVTFEGTPGSVEVTPYTWDFAPPVPTPEPGTLTSLACGALALAGFALRRPPVRPTTAA
jgi:hypothetical protein